MRTITITKTICQFEELTEKAKEKAVDNTIRSYGWSETEFLSDDYRATLEMLERTLHIKISPWEVDGQYRYNYKFRFTDYRWDSWTCDYEDDPKFLVRYLNNEILPFIQGKYYGKCYADENGNYIHKKRYSKITNETSCLLTGTYTDRAFDEAVKNAYEFVRKGYTIREFVNEILDEFFTSWGRDLDYATTYEFAMDTIDSLGLEFYENGEIYGEM